MSAAMGIILPAEADCGVGDGEQPMVGDGDAVGIACQVVKHMFGTSERRFGIDDPVLPVQSAQESSERMLIAKGYALAEKVQPVLSKESPQAGDELAAKDAAEQLYRQQEAGAGSWSRK
jgi:hypothetical protein